MPAVEAGVGQVVRWRDGVFVESPVMGMLEFDVTETFILGNVAVADDLNFRLVWDGLQIRVQDAAFGVEGFAMPVTLGLWVKTPGELILGLWRAIGLAFEDDYLALIQSIVDKGEVRICIVVNSGVPMFYKMTSLPGGYRSTECSILYAYMLLRFRGITTYRSYPQHSHSQ